LNTIHKQCNAFVGALKSFFIRQQEHKFFGPVTFKDLRPTEKLVSLPSSTEKQQEKTLPSPEENSRDALNVESIREAPAKPRTEIEPAPCNLQILNTIGGRMIPGACFPDMLATIIVPEPFANKEIQTTSSVRSLNPRRSCSSQFHHYLQLQQAHITLPIHLRKLRNTKRTIPEGFLQTNSKLSSSPDKPETTLH